MHRPAPRPTRAVVVLGLVSLCILLLVNGYVQHRADLSLREASHWVEHTLDVESQLQIVGSLLRDAETGQRGYLLTGERSYLEPHRIAIRELPSAMQSLKTLTADDPAQLRNLSRLQELVENKLNELRDTIALYDQGNPEAARAVVQTNLGKNYMDDIRVLLSQMSGQERTHLAEREKSLRSVELKQRLALFLGLAIAILAVIAFGWGLHRAELIREAAHDEILESEEWLSTTLTSIGDAVIATDALGNVRFLNPVAQNLTKFTQDKAAGRPLTEVFPIFNETTREVAESPVQKAISTGKVVGLANHTVLVRADGSEIAIDDSAAPILNRAGKITGVVLVFRDVTEQRKIERAMRTSEKLAATGRLAATVAHEINNPLEAAANLLYLLQDEPGLTSEGRNYLRLADQQLMRVSQITRQTLAFYRDPRTPEPLPLASVCGRILDLFRPRLRNKELLLEVQSDKDVVVLGTEGELAQVVANLLSNAIDASNPNGRVDFRVSREDHHALITVSDTGTGITPANLPKVFEPFFTTKKDVGTGLGLWVSQEIVQKLGGTIRAQSAGENQGASFVVSLPIYETARNQEAG